MSTQHLIKAFENDILNHKKLIRLAWLWALMSLIAVITVVYLTGLRNDVWNHNIQTALVLGMAGICLLHVGLYASLFKTSQSYRHVTIVTAVSLLVMTYWAPAMSMVYGLQWGGLGSLNFWSADYICFLLGFQVSAAMLLLHVVIQFKMRMIPTATNYFIVGTLAASSGLLTQGLHCGGAAILHLSAAHFGQAALTLVLCVGAQSLLFTHQKKRLKRV